MSFMMLIKLIIFSIMTVSISQYYCITTLTLNYKSYVIILVIPNNSYNNFASSDVFTCV